MIPDLPNLSPEADRQPQLPIVPRATHPPRILLLYGSLRERSYSRFATLEAERLLRHFGCETRIFHANGLPLPDDAAASHPKVQELRTRYKEEPQKMQLKMMRIYREEKVNPLGGCLCL